MIASIRVMARSATLRLVSTLLFAGAVESGEQAFGIGGRAEKMGRSQETFQLIHGDHGHIATLAATDDHHFVILRNFVA